MNQTERIPVRISPDLLDTIGRQFRFRHGKGISEWLKNSLDQYLRLRSSGRETLAGGWPVLLNLADGTSISNGPNIVLIDFGGTNFGNVQNYFLHWGDSSAATHGGSSDAMVTGGHGNGGKFYMREMWKGGCRLVTWLDGRMTSLVVEKAQDGTTGYWEVKDEKADWRDALYLAHDGLPGQNSSAWVFGFLEAWKPELIQDLDQRRRGLTALVGRRAVQINSSNDLVIGKRWNTQKVIDDILDSAQAKRPLRELEIHVFVNGFRQPRPLEDREVPRDPDFPSREFRVPGHLLEGGGSQSQEEIGSLLLVKADAPLTGRLKHLNSLYVLDGGGNPVASYPIKELPLPSHSPIASFISAELVLTIPNLMGFVQNDRERLLQSPFTEALLNWVVQQIAELMHEVKEIQESQDKQRELQQATILNDQLNDHATRFLQQLETDMFVDYIDSSDGGGFGDEGEGISPQGDGQADGETRERGTGGGEGIGGTIAVPGTEKKVRRPNFPQVLLSGIDADPADPDGRTRILTSRHPPLDQDETDRLHNVWWINTAHPFAVLALDKGGAAGVPFRNHQLSMFRDVVQREGLRYLQRRSRELDLDQVENELSDISNRFLGELPRALAELLMSAEE